MAFTNEEIEEFRTECEELLDMAEQSLLALDRGEPLESQYDSIFRAYHSLKGAAGMMEMSALQSHMHQLENLLSEGRARKSLDHGRIEFFLSATDAARRLLRGESVAFDFQAKTGPIASGQSPAPAPAAKPLAAPGPAPAGKAMVVDDEPDLTAVLQGVLESAGFEVAGYTNAKDVIENLAAFQPDILLSDISMPGMDGMQLLAEVRKTQPDLPVIFISGFVDKNSLMKAIELDAYSVIEKPFQPHRVIDISLNAAKRHQLNRLLNRSINLIMYQYADLDAWLAEKGKDDVRKTIREEIGRLIKQRDELRNLHKRKRS